MGYFRINRGFAPGLAQAQRAVDEGLLHLCRAYLPVDTGRLRNSGAVASPGKVCWTAGHAAACYRRPGGAWAERMLADKPGALAGLGADALGGRVKR